DLLGQVPQLFPPARVRTLSAAATLLRVDLRTAGPRVHLEGLRARFNLRDGRALGGFVLWADMELAPGVRPPTRPPTSARRSFLPAEPGGRGPRVAHLELTKGRRGTRWRVAVARRGRTEVREPSPLSAGGALRAGRAGRPA